MQVSIFDRFRLATRTSQNDIPLVLLTQSKFEEYKEKKKGRERVFLDHMSDEPGNAEEWSDGPDSIKKTFVVLNSHDDRVPDPHFYMYALSEHATSLRAGCYALADYGHLSNRQRHNLTLGWALGAYVFDKYKSKKVNGERPRLVIPKGVDRALLKRQLEATALAQDLINEPPNILTPQVLGKEALNLAERFSASVSVIQGKKLESEYPLINIMGAGAAQNADHGPRLVDMRWGNPSKPALVLVGKGVTFDSGGKQTKCEDMANMKYDMAGAAHAMALALMIMDAKLPVHLRMLLPIIDNTEGPDAVKPGAVITSRKGDHIEITDTDAEGRVILADALWEASHPGADPMTPVPRLILDFGTLGWHGAFQFPGYATLTANTPKLERAFMKAVAQQQEYCTTLPLIRGLIKELQPESAVGDLISYNTDHSRYPDILATVFLHHHVGDDVAWGHIDLDPWRESKAPYTHMPPSLPDGAFAQCVRSAYDMIEDAVEHRNDLLIS